VDAVQTADSEQYRPLSYFARRYGGHPSSWTRRILRGDSTPVGRIRLKAVRLGSKWVTTERAVSEHLAAVTAAHLGMVAAGEPPASRSPSARRRASEAAAKELKRMGC
jgi:hypothetical protein